MNHRLRSLPGLLLVVSLLACADRATIAADQSEGAAPQKRDVTFDDIQLDLKKNDPYTPDLLTEKVKKLDGRPIKIRGYILPGFQQAGIKQFVLTRDNKECCFGPGAALHDCILVEMQGIAYDIRELAKAATSSKENGEEVEAED